VRKAVRTSHLGADLHTKNIMQKWYTEELRKIHGPNLEDPRSVSFNVDVAYAADGGTPHERYVKILIIFR
jgi:hypothetical protein